MNLIRVVLADDHPVVRQGIRALLEHEADIEVIGEAANGEETLHQVIEHHPDVLLLDIELPDVQGMQVAKLVRQMDPDVKILALSAHDDAVYIKGLLETGAAGYLMKEEAPEVILEAVRGVVQGKVGWVSRNVAAQMTAWMQEGKPDSISLTPRELEVLRLLVDGKTNQAISIELSISEKTVEKFIRSIFSKFNVNSRVEAAVFAVRERLV
jgi:DNA-binding NarL/FixJ family response regulator